MHTSPGLRPGGLPSISERTRTMDTDHDKLLGLVTDLLIHHIQPKGQPRKWPVRLVKNEDGATAVVLQLDGWYNGDPSAEVVESWQAEVDAVVEEVERRQRR